MTEPTSENQVQEIKSNEKELNFRRQEEKYERLLAQERAKREEAERLAQQYAHQKTIEEDDDDSEPYVDHKKLNKTLSRFGQNTQTEIQKAMEVAKKTAKEELKREMWLENNPDFYEVLNHAEKFAQKAPKLAETILKMPEGFERQQLVYQNIKELGLHRPEEKQSSVQDKIDANRRSPFYQPSGMGTSPYAAVGDYSSGGQKQAYDKMKELQQRLRLS